MKNIAIGFLVAVTIVAVMGADLRNRPTNPIVRYDLATATIPANDANAVTVTTLVNGNIIAANCLLERMTVKASNMDNGITYTVAITDENSGSILSIASIAENATTEKNALKATPDFNPTPLYNTLTVTVTPSGDPGATPGTVNIYLYGI